VNTNAESDQMTVNPIIECNSRDLILEYYQGLESSIFYTEPPCFVESLSDYSNWSLPHLPFHMHGEEIISALLTLNIYIVL
jgi:hypothetical protein